MASVVHDLGQGPNVFVCVCVCVRERDYMEGEAFYDVGYDKPVGDERRGGKDSRET